MATTSFDGPSVDSADHVRTDIFQEADIGRDLDVATLVHLLEARPELRDPRDVAVTLFPDKSPNGESLQAGCDASLANSPGTRTLPQELNDVVARGRKID